MSEKQQGDANRSNEARTEVEVEELKKLSLDELLKVAGGWSHLANDCMD